MRTREKSRTATNYWSLNSMLNFTVKFCLWRSYFNLLEKPNLFVALDSGAFHILDTINLIIIAA